MLPPREPPLKPPAEPREPLKLLVPPLNPLRELPLGKPPLKLPLLPESLKPPVEGADRNDELEFPDPILGENDREPEEPSPPRLLMLFPEDSRNPASPDPLVPRIEFELPSDIPRVLRVKSDRPIVPVGELRTALPI